MPSDAAPGRFRALVRLVFLAAVLLVAGAAAHAAGPPALSDGCRRVYVADHGWHTGLIILRQDYDSRASLRTTYFDGKRWLEFGWGDAAFYQAEEMSIGLALRALFVPTDTVMHVYGFDGDPVRNFPNSETLSVRVTEAGYRRMLDFIRAAFARDDAGQLAPLGRGLYGLSLFYRANGTYSLERTCNTWTAEALQAAGVAIDPAEAATSGGVMSQLQEIGPTVCADPPPS